MFQRYSFLVLFISLLSVLAWWSGRVESAWVPPTMQSGQTALSPEAELEQRRELIEALDRLVAYEHYYRSVYGHFTKLLSRLGYSIPASLLETYNIQAVEASRGGLLITASSEINGRTRDTISIDQDFEVRSSFELPGPRPQYLKVLALKKLRALRDDPNGAVSEEPSVFKGYFSYEVSPEGDGGRKAIAIGTRAPVLGLKLELSEDGTDLAEVAAERDLAEAPRTGQSAMSTLEEAYLAQKIFRGEVGRYAKSWSELSKIAAFRFEDKEQYEAGGKVPFGDTGALIEIDAATASQGPDAEHDSSRKPGSVSQPLEIEDLSLEVHK